MIPYSEKKGFFLIFIYSLLSSFFVYEFPVKAANFTSLSQYQIELKTFNQSPQDLSSIVDGDAITIANNGVLFSSIDAEAQFLVKPNIITAYSNSQTILFGSTNDFFGNIQFSSTLIGSFSIQAQDSLQFSVDGFLNLFNTTDDLTTSNLSSFVQIDLFLRDKTTQDITNVLQVLGLINTNSDAKLRQDSYRFQVGSDLILNNYSQMISSAQLNKAIQSSFSGLFQKQFLQNTQLDLIMVTQSCNYTSNQLGVCEKIPEPDNKFILIDLLVLLCSIRFMLGVMK